MNAIAELVAQLHKLGVKLWVEGDELCYKAPKGALTPELRDQLRAQKPVLRAFLQKAAASPQTAAETIAPVARDRDLPLSFSQERLWFLEQLGGPGAVYNSAIALQLTGQLQVALLEQSLTEIVRRHEVLRTTFMAKDGVPFQKIVPAQPVTLHQLDLQHLAEAAQAVEVRRFAIADSQRPFQLETGPLWRFTLLKLQAQSAVLVVIIHHIISDGWSMGILVHEFGALYAAFLQGQPSPLPELAIQYADFADWQRQWLTGANLERQVTYWRQQLTGAPPLLNLPTDRPRPAVQTFRGATAWFEVDQALTRQLRELSRQAGATLFMTLLAAFAILLARYSGQEDLVIGTSIANRNRREIEPLLGFFLNALALRLDLTNNPSFQEFLQRVKEMALAAYAHQDLPFELLVDKLQPERNLSHNPLFQVMFQLQNVPMPKLELPGLTLTPLPVERFTARFDLFLPMEETATGLRGELEYNTDLFDQTTIDRMIGHFQMILKGVAVNPAQPIAEIPLLTETERRQLLVEWNATQVTYPLETGLHHLIEAQVARTPDAAAVIIPEPDAVRHVRQQLSYRELNARANQLAHYLQARGVGPEVLVGVCVERSVEMIVGLLGILKAGGAYVPLDPEYPAERLAFMLADSQVPVLLTQAKFVNMLPVRNAQVVCLDADWERIAQESAENPHSGVTADNLIYMIYTSGSTGQPKGALNIHRALVNRLLWMQDAYQLTPADRVLQKTPFSFDVAGWEFFWPLLTGAGLVFAKPGGHKESAYLVKLIAAQQISTLHFVPSMLQVFLEEEGLAQCRQLKRVICSGEALSGELQKRFFERLTAELHNLYGPTEAAIDVSYWQCDRASPTVNVPIGRPIANTQLYILDVCLQPTPIGVPGELYIGGVNLARGYLNRPELTHERFIPNPFREGTRLYKTGDLARYLPDGNIEFLGRLDHQVKIRGFRIELGEIEAVLAGYAGIREVVIIDREDRPGDKQLLAYLVAEQTPPPTISELRRFLAAKLPEYMIPQTFVFLAQMPLTPNGKIDRRALPVPEAADRRMHKTYSAPRTPTENELAAMLADVLKLERVGVHDNFFEIGGHSLLATQLVARIRKTFQVELPLRQIFDTPTVANLAESIETVRWFAQTPAASALTTKREEIEL